jgi:ubiquinone/menaquinone biosynthesis C-methylase UbiE
MDEQAHETTRVYDQFAETYREKHADRSVITDQLTSFLGALDGNNVLDVGCGPGWESAMFAEQGLTATGIDLSRSFLSMANEVVRDAQFSRMDMRSLGFSSRSFDGVWACASIHHVPRTDIDTVFAEFHRVLNPSGIALLTCKRGATATTSEAFGSDDARQFVRYEPDKLNELATRNGFEVCSLEATRNWSELLMKVSD